MKKVVSALLIMLMLIQTVSFAATDKIYTDKSTIPLVENLRTLGIFDQFDDEKHFGENTNVKRSEAAVVISNMLGMKDSGGNSSTEIKFFDVPQYREYINAVNYVTGLGIMSGNSEGKFLPDDPMEMAHVYKALVTALGYGWKAEAYGGYPAGYVRVAAELEIANVVPKGINENATRLDFLRMVEAALDAPICRMKSVSGDVMDFEVDEDVTVLSEYHNIYFDEGVVENNKSMNISSTPEIDEDIVFIDGRKLYVNGVTSVYANFGYKVEYYYRHDSVAEADYLVAVSPSDENTEIKISKADFDGFANGKITYYDETGKEKDIKVSGSVVVLYNSEVATNVSTAINSFEGTLTVIDNNNDRQADVIIAKNYTYDKVKSVKAAENKIYANNKVFNLDLYEVVDIVVAESGEATELATIAADTVIGYATSVDGSKLMIDVLGSNIAVKVKTISQDTFTTDDGKEYNMELLSAEHKALIKLNTAVTIVTMDGYYPVWANTASETVLLGYLINIATEAEFGEEHIVGARILDTTGDIKAFKTANEKKIILNGKSVNIATMFSELERVKSDYRLGGDGRVSQVISYKLDDNGNLTHIYTVDNENDNTTLYLKYGYGRDGKAVFYSNHGYGTPRFKSKNVTYNGKVPNVHSFYTHNYMITRTQPIFIVPETNQETAGEEWYGLRSNATYYSDNDGVEMPIETYTSGEFEIVPKGMVEYLPSDSETEIFNVVTSGDIVLIDSTYQTLNSDDGADYVISGFSKGKAVSYIVDGTKVDVETIDALKANPSDTNEEAGFTKGDLATVQVDVLGKVIQVAKVFDHETENIHPELHTDTATGQTCALVAHTYNKPADGYGLEFFEEDLTIGVPSTNRKLMISLHTLGLGKVNEKAATFMFYDDAQERVYLGSSQDVIDYQQDPVNYTRIFLKHKNSGVELVFYNK